MRSFISSLLKNIRLRGQILIASLILVSCPLLVVLALGPYDAFELRRHQKMLGQLAESLTTEIDRSGIEKLDELQFLRRQENLPERFHLLIRLVDRSGHVRELGAMGHAEVASIELDLGPILERFEVQEALESGVGEEVRASERHDAYAFYRATKLSATDGTILYLTHVTPRHTRILFDHRTQMFKLTLGLLIGAALTGLWLGRSVVGPLRRLQRQIQSSLKHGSPSSLALPRNDEIGMLSKSFDELLRRLELRIAETASVAGDLAHDLKSPIAAIKASAELLEAPNVLSDERRMRIARAIALSSEHMSRTVEALLTWTKMDELMIREARSNIALKQLILEVSDSYREKAEAKRIFIQVIGEDAVIHGIPDRIAELVRNLFDNALLFARSRIVVTVSKNDPSSGRGAHASLPANASTRINHLVFVSVEDDGPGVSSGNQERIFQRFFSLRPDEAPKGSGLGLSIVASIARAHGGHIELLNVRGPASLEGACFCVRLPVLAEMP